MNGISSARLTVHFPILTIHQIFPIVRGEIVDPLGTIREPEIIELLMTSKLLGVVF